MGFADSSINHFEFSLFLKKCKQTAEISWLFFWDIKISKKFINKNFSVFYCDVKTYLTLCSPSTQREISHFPDIHLLLSVVKLKWKKSLWKIQLILHLLYPYCFALIGIVVWSSGSLPKLKFFINPGENQ